MAAGVQTDALALLSLLGLVLGVASGGKIEGGGLQVGARIPLGADGLGPVEIGATPIAHMSAPSLPGALSGITLGGTTIAVRPNDWVIESGKARSPDSVWREITQYEYGHLPGWSHFGLEYALRSQAEPYKYDPATGLIPVERRSFVRQANPWELQPKHYALKVVLDNAAREADKGGK